MAITKRQRQQRRKFVGGSDQPILFGCGFGGETPHDLWLEKLGRVEEKEATLPMRLGTALEPALVDLLVQQLRDEGRKVEGVKRGLLMPHPRHACMGVNLDAYLVVDGEPCVAEAKTTGLMGTLKPDLYGEPGTDEVPEAVIVQAHHAKACVPDVARIYVPALVGYRGFAVFVVEPVVELVEACEDRACKFWEHVVAKTPPPSAPPTLDTIKRVKRVPERTIRIADELWLDYRRACENLDAVKAAHLEAAEAEVEVTKRRLLAALGDAEAGVVNGRGDMVTYLEQHRKGYEVQPCTFRQMKFVKSDITKAEEKAAKKLLAEQQKAITQ